MVHATLLAVATPSGGAIYMWYWVCSRSPAGDTPRPLAPRGLLTNVLNPKAGTSRPAIPLARSRLLAGLHIGTGVAGLSTLARLRGGTDPAAGESRRWRTRLEG